MNGMLLVDGDSCLKYAVLVYGLISVAWLLWFAHHGLSAMA